MALRGPSIFYLTSLLSAALLGLSGIAAQAQSFSFAGFSFDRSEYLTSGELQTAVKPYTNRQITFPDVQRLVADVQDLYAQKGIVTARVLLEPQEVAIGGVLHLSLIEARVGRIDTQPSTGIKARILEKASPLRSGEKPDYVEIAKAKRFLELAHGAALAVNFEPGSAPETARATQSVKTDNSLQYSVAANNHLTDSLGNYGANATISSFDRFGALERLTGSLQVNKGGQTLAGALSWPISAGVRANIGAELSKGRVVNGPTAILDPASRRKKMEFRLSGPFAIRADRYKSWSLGYSYEQSNSTLLGLALSRVRLHEVKASFSGQRLWGQAALSYVFGIAFGTSDSGGASNTDGPYRSASLNVQFARRLSPKLTFELAGSAQIAPNQNLPALRQFSVGGASTLVGYPNFVASGDSGLHVRAKLICPAPCFDGLGDTFSVSPFAFWDLGYVVPFSSNNAAMPANSALTSLGVGLSVQVNKLSVLAQVGVPLRSTASFNAEGEVATTVAVSYSF